MQLYDYPHNMRKINFKKYLNIEHIKCVGNAIANAIANNELALEWISYHIELKDSIERIIACDRYDPVNQKMYIV